MGAWEAGDRVGNARTLPEPPDRSKPRPADQIHYCCRASPRRPPLGSIVSGFILFIVAAMAIGQLEFDTEMVRIATACVLGGFALAFALSVGLGTREITRNVLSGFYARKLFNPGIPWRRGGHGSPESTGGGGKCSALTRSSGGAGPRSG